MYIRSCVKVTCKFSCREWRRGKIQAFTTIHDDNAEFVSTMHDEVAASTRNLQRITSALCFEGQPRQRRARTAHCTRLCPSIPQWQTCLHNPHSITQCRVRPCSAHKDARQRSHYSFHSRPLSHFGLRAAFAIVAFGFCVTTYEAHATAMNGQELGRTQAYLGQKPKKPTSLAVIGS